MQALATHSHLVQVTAGAVCWRLSRRTFTLSQPLNPYSASQLAKLVVGDLAAPDQGSADPQLIVLLQDARRAQALALAKPNLSLEQLARTFGRSTERYKRLLRLSYLSPTFIEAVIGGGQPSRVTNRFLQNLDGIPLNWIAQEDLLLR